MKTRRKIFRYFMIILTVTLILSTVSCAPSDQDAADETTPIDNESNTINDNVTTPDETTKPKPATTTPAETTEKIMTKMENTVTEFFSKYRSRDKDSVCIVIDNYVDSCDLFDAMQTVKPGYSGILRLQGNMVRHSEEYFKTHYIIAILHMDSSGSCTHRLSAEIKDDNININIISHLPAVSTNDIGGFINIVEIEGKYNNERINYSFTREMADSYSEW